MNHRFIKRASSLSVAALVLSSLIPAASKAAPPGPTVNGTLTEIDGIPVLRVWGTPHERGFAHGYLLADMMADLAEGYFRDGPLGGTLERYENKTLPRLENSKIEPEFEAEMRGILAGIEAALGGPLEVPFLGRAFAYQDVLAINCTGDLARTACSSFAAWGPLTKNGHTIAGRNMDWPVVPALLDTLIVHVNVPPPDSGKIGWAGVTWPTYIGCITGMNAEGVTVATHDARGYPPSVDSGFRPYGWTFRKALESARASSVVDDIAGAIRDGVSVVGNNMMVNRPYTGQGPGAFVFEFDGDLTNDGGLTVRKPPPTDSFLVCTNHFRQRAQPIECGRYTRLEGVLRRYAASDGKRHIDHKRAWKMLAGSSIEGILTYHSVVFEPNERLMHVAFTEDSKHAPKCRKVTLDVAKLVAGDYPGGR